MDQAPTIGQIVHITTGQYAQPLAAIVTTTPIETDYLDGNQINAVFFTPTGMVSSTSELTFTETYPPGVGEWAWPPQGH